MPVNVSSAGMLADRGSSNARASLNHRDVSIDVDQGNSSSGFAHFSHGPNQMAQAQELVNSPTDQDRNRDIAKHSRPILQGRQSNERLLQIPSTSQGQKPPTPTAVWDWSTDLDLLGESSSYMYEPQGELLRVEQLEHSQSKEEFSIPHAVAGSGLQWNVEAPAVDDEGFIVPQRPSSTSAQSLSGSKRKSPSEGSVASGQPDRKRSSHLMSDTSEGASPHAGTSTAPAGARGQSAATARVRSQTDTSDPRAYLGVPNAAGGRAGPSRTAPRRTLTDPSIPLMLPARKVFPIQIGDRLFRLSGASISSDAPSYFTQFFEEQLRQNEGADSVRTLYIDRDPATFEDISLHLQGYHIEPRDGPHFVKLFADAQFFSLPRLTQQLFSSAVYISIGNENFHIPRELFGAPGNSPNYFSLGFSMFFNNRDETFPGLSQRTLLRPPSILPPSVPNRSAQTFADLLHILKGYPVEIRSEQHRTELLRDARYYHLKGLEQRLIPHSISFNLARKKSEIIVRLEDIRQSGVSFVADGQDPPPPPPRGQSPASPSSSTTAPGLPYGPGWVYYQRPYVDPEPYSLVLEVGGSESTYLAVGPGARGAPARVGRAIFHDQTLARITSLFSVVANKMNLPITQPLGLMMMERGAGVASLPVSPANTGVSDDKVKVRIGQDADVMVDGEVWRVGSDDGDGEDDESGMEVDEPSDSQASPRKRRRRAQEQDEGEDWVVKKAQWRLRVQPLSSGQAGSGRTGMEVILGAVKIEAYSNERGRNAARGFLV